MLVSKAVKIFSVIRGRPKSKIALPDYSGIPLNEEQEVFLVTDPGTGPGKMRLFGQSQNYQPSSFLGNTLVIIAT